MNEIKALIAAEPLPYDVQAIDEFLTALIGPSGDPVMVAASLLDSDRRGHGFLDLALSLSTVIHQTAAKLADVNIRQSITQDLTETLEQTGLSEGVANPAVLPLFRCCEINFEPGSADPLLWLECLPVFDIEGYSLGWLSRRLARQRGIDWNRVISTADSIMASRRNMAELA